MTFNSLSFSQRASGTGGKEVDEIRTLVAKHLDIDIKYVTSDAHLTDDLGADWLDRLELLMLIEDEFAGVEISDGDPDQIQTVGDLIRYIVQAFLFPFGAPGDGSPCIRQRPFGIAGDWHLLPQRLRSRHRGARCIGNCMGLFLSLRRALPDAPGSARRQTRHQRRARRAQARRR